MPKDSEPSVEDILRSIKQVIARDDDSTSAGASVPVEPVAPPVTEFHQPHPSQHPVVAFPAANPGSNRPATEADADDDAILDLDSLGDFAEPEDKSSGSKGSDGLIAGQAASSIRESLTTLRDLSAAAGPVASGGANALEDIVREMLRPMLKDWLDANLPEIIEHIVQQEIARITGGR